MTADSITLIAPYLAPAAVGPRAARSRRIATGLRAAGHRVHVVAVDDRSSVDPAAAMLASAPGPLVGAMGEPGLSARRGARAAVVERARRLIPLPDAHARWAAAVLRDPALARPPDPNTAIYAIAAPFSSLVAGVLLGRRWGVPVIGDLGDPWPGGGVIGARLAAWTIGQLSALVVTNERTADAYSDIVDGATTIVVAPNGADPIGRDATPAGEPPLFLQLGTLSSSRIDPTAAYGALAELDREGLIRFRSYGEAWVRLAPDAAQHHRGVIGTEAARERLREAAAVVVIGNRNALQIPSKVYEIARSQAWALYVSELEPDPGAEVLRVSGHGVIRCNDAAAIRAGALEIIERERRGERPQPTAGFGWEAMLDRIMTVVGRYGGAEHVAEARVHDQLFHVLPHPSVRSGRGAG